MSQETDLFRSGEKGYHTYRIPALVVTSRGTLLAFCEGRRNGTADDGDIDLMVRRGTNQGVLWFEQQVVYGEAGDITIGNPCPVVDHGTGIVWLFMTRNNDDVLLTHSSDDGVTWSPPEDMTQRLKAMDLTGWIGTGPGHGIQLVYGPRKGRLLVPTHAVVGQGADRQTHCFVIYSNDPGKTWQSGGRTDPGGECLAVEMDDGDIYLTIRSQAARKYAWSRDGGESWEPVRMAEDLPEPTCQASIVGYAAKGARGQRVLFSNPAVQTCTGGYDVQARRRLTVRISDDECRTWPYARVVHEGPAGYSDLAVAPDGTVLCLFECGETDYRERIRLVQFSTRWLESGS